MPLNFSGPTSRPISLGDNYSLYKRSIIPVVPVVDSIILEEGEVAEPIETVLVVEATQDGGQEELDVKRKTSPTEESSPAGESKKSKQEETVDQSAGQGSDLVENPTPSTGGEVTAISSESNGDEPKVGDTSSSVPAEPERDHPKQETDKDIGDSKV